MGLSFVIALVARQGLVEVGAATAVAGYGVLWVACLQFVPMMCDTMAWRQILVRQPGVSLVGLFWARWLGESVNNLLPAARIGGEVVRGWLAFRKLDLPGSIAGASVIVDMTGIIAAQILFTTVGLAVLVMHGGDHSLVSGAAIGIGLLLAMLAVFLLAQRAGIFVIYERLARALMRRFGRSSLGSDTDALDAGIREFYKHRGRFMQCVLFHWLGWTAGVLEVWAGLWLLGHPVSFLDALMLESLIQAVRGAAFFMPGALGLQEGGFILLGAIIGIGPEVALALSLIKRIRELMWGLPGLLIWQFDGLRRQFLRTESSMDH
jgi:putative membrane protein